MPEFSVFGATRLRFQQSLGPSWKDLAVYFNIPAHVVARWQQGDEPHQVWEYLHVRGMLDKLPAALVEIDRNDLADILVDASGWRTADASAPTARPRLAAVKRPRILVSAGLAVVLLVALIVVWVRARGEPPNYTVMPDLPAPSAGAWGTTLTCLARTQWPYAFSPEYVGDVYVQFTADPRRSVDVRATISWGGGTWSQTVPAMPGDMLQRVGGTLLVFQKRNADRGKPVSVTFETDVPVCATFGTAADTPPAAPSLRLPTPHWD